MNDGMFIFDCVVHTQDFTDRQIAPGTDGKNVVAHRQNQQSFNRLMASKGGPADKPDFYNPVDPDWARAQLFERSQTDIAMVQTVPLFGPWKDSLGPAQLCYDLAQRDPERLIFCGGVDPSWQGLEFALDEMERQVVEWGAKSFKFYGYQDRDHHWRADDPELAYPLYEKALELGIKLVQFHKGYPLGMHPVEAFRPNDLQMAAYDFPELNFGIHHMGDPYVDETISIAGRFPNIHLMLPLWFNQYFLQPYPMLHRIGQALLSVGPDRLAYGSEGFIWPDVQAYITMWANLEMPDELQDRYGYPELTREIKEKIFGLNFAAALGYEIPEQYRGGDRA
ncbi:amidohydrolase family protein [Subtercola lobariae]|uniref:Amidohydrolase n=1 Tax=Subtercola lobariae TaxID=1588641 RepID=A0A917BBZ2_9MICO|nr:amidohydrolase family protein [Subtercola lobariae]GGF36244.1 amidohydrolase [Subtercola lobariae]